MAYDKNQLMMHQLQVKAKRLDAGLKRLVEALKVGGDNVLGRDETVLSAYQYALGCLGGDYLKKELFKTDAFECVVMQLKEQKYMKADVADKNIAVWRSKREKEGAKAEKQEKVVCGVDLAEKPSESVNAEVEVTHEGKMNILAIEVVKEDADAVAKVENVENTEKAEKSANAEKPMRFGEVNEHGEIVPKKKAEICEYAEPPRVESKSGEQPSGFGLGDQSHKRGPIYCY